MNLVDSCGWLEYFADGPNADFFAAPIGKVGVLLVPTICVVEVFRRMLQQLGEDAALEAAGTMRNGHIADLDVPTAISAGRIGPDLGLSLADSIIVATAMAFGAEIWTQDADFARIPGVKYAKRK